MFLYENMNSISNAKKVRQLVNHFAHQVAQHARHTKIGMLTQPCIASTIPLTSVAELEEELALSSVRDNMYLPDLVQDLRKNNFYDVLYTETRVAVLVIDSQTKNLNRLKKEVRKLRFKNVRIMVVAVGKVEENLIKELASYPLNQNAIRVETYDQLEIKNFNILKRLCANQERFPL